MCRRAPDCVAIGLTSGQLSTDSFNAGWVIAHPTGLRVPAPLRYRVEPEVATAGGGAVQAGVTAGARRDSVMAVSVGRRSSHNVAKWGEWMRREPWAKSPDQVPHQPNATAVDHVSGPPARLLIDAVSGPVASQPPIRPTAVDQVNGPRPVRDRWSINRLGPNEIGNRLGGGGVIGDYV